MKPFVYIVKDFEAIDGDTVKVSLDLGFHATIKTSVRIVGVDAPEKNKADQKAAAAVTRAAAERWLKEHAGSLVCVSRELDKYGRVLGDFVADSPDEDRDVSLARYLLFNGLVRPYDGGTRGPWEKSDLDSIEAKAKEFGL